jgi:DNA primase
MCLAEELAKLSARRGAQRELAEALGRAETADENVLWRLGRAVEALLGNGPRENVESDYEIGPNGAEVRRDEKKALDALIGSIDFRGGRRGRD